MNSNLFKTVFSQRLGALIAVGEHTSGQGKATGGRVAGQVPLWRGAVGGARYLGLVNLGFAFVSLAWAAPANNALPTGGQVAQGAAAISQSGTNMAIAQSTARAIVNWQSFDIGKDAKVNIIQPNAQAVLLNRVTGVAPSQIFGQMSANGQVVLVNPNGVTFGKDGSVSAAGLTASTLNISDADFMAGRKRFTRDGATGEVVNQGTLTAAPGGYVALLGASVSNEGQIYAPQGNVALGAADAITLPMTGTGRIKMELSPAAINASVANQKGGTIVTEGGQVYMQAAAVGGVLGHAMASVLQSGSIDTSGEQGGAVHLLADGGTIKVDGSITANSTGKDDKGQARKGGDIIIGRDEETGVLAQRTDVSGALLESKSGFVETSGADLKVDGISVKAKDWLLDPDNIDITGDAVEATTGYSKIKASDIATALNAGTSVTVATTAANQVNQPDYKDTAGTGAGSAVTGDGNILVNAAIVKSGANDASLTLNADNGITVNQRIGKASGDTSSTGKLDVTMTASGNAATVTDRSGLTLNNVIDAGDGHVILTGTNSNTNTGSRGVNFNNGSGITANTITVTGTATGSAQWNQGMLFSGTSSFKATGTGSSVISGISSSATDAFTAAVIFNDGSNVTLDGGTGSLTLQGTHTVTGYSGIRFGATSGSSTNPSLTTRGNVTLGTQDASNASLNAGFFMRGGLITADTGTLAIKGQGTGNGVTLFDGFSTIKSNGGSIALNGVATTNGSGVYLVSNSVGTLNSGADVSITGTSAGANAGVQFNSGNVRVYGNNVTINGTANTASGQTGYGFYSVLGPFIGNTITAAGNLSITGTVNGAGSGTAIAHVATSWQNRVNAYTAGGTLSITGTNNASAANTSTTITMAGVQAKAGGDLTVSATTNNAATDAISIYSSAYLSGAAAPGYIGGASSFESTGGNTTLKSNQGSILIQDGVPNTVTSTAISGKNVIIDNTGGTFAGGVFTAGTGVSTSTVRSGVQISDGLAVSDPNLASNPTLRTITATDGGQIVLSGKKASTSGSGVVISSAAALSAANITINGENTGTSDAAINISSSAAKLTATAAVTLTAGGTGSGTSLVAAGNIAVGTQLHVTTPAAGSISGVISGAGSLLKSGAGQLSLTAVNGTTYGTNTFSGGSTVSQGTLLLGHGGGNYNRTAGAGAIVVGDTNTGSNNVALLLEKGVPDNTSGPLTRDITFTNNGTGTATLGTTVGIAGDANRGWTSANSKVTFYRDILINDATADRFTLDGQFTGTGNITFSGTRITMSTLTGNGISANDFVGDVTISSGTMLQASAKYILPSTTNLTNNGNFRLLNGSDQTIDALNGSGTITTTGSLPTTVSVGNHNGSGNFSGTIVGVTPLVNLVKNGTGTQILSGANNYAGTTVINAGTLQIGNGGTSGSIGTGAITDNAALVFNRSDAGLVVSAKISGTGTVTQAGTGTTILSADNDWSGATTISAGTLQVGNGGTTGTLGTSTTVTDNGTLAFKRSDNISADLKITGTGGLTQAGTGTLTLLDSAALYGVNDYSGATTISAGTLQVGNGGTAGNLGTGAIVNSGTLAINHSDGVTLSQAISGGGALTQSGTGTTTLTGANTYSGTTTISSGILQVGDGGTTGTLGTGAVIDNASLFFRRSDTLWVGGVISGTGAITQAGTGTTILANNNTYAGTTTISSGTLQVGSGFSTGSLGTGDILNTGALVFNRGDTGLVVSAKISGTGSVTQAGSGGTTTLTADNDWSGTTTISAGTLQIGNGGTTGTLGTATTVTTNGTLSFRRSDNLSVGLKITGNGGLTQAGSGTLTLIDSAALNGVNDYKGTTTISAGTLQVGNGGTSGNLGTGNIQNNSSLVLNRSDTLTINSGIGGSGTLAQSGTGTTILAGNNSYAGTTTVNTGSLQIGNGGAIGSLGVGAASVAANANLSFRRSDNSVSISNAITGAGNLNFVGTGVQDQSSYSLSANNSAFTGNISITSARLNVSAATQVGATSPITVNSGGQLLANGSITLNNPLSLAGTGWNEGSGLIGALRMVGGVNYAGNITPAANTRIATYGNGITGTISGVISGDKNIEFSSQAGVGTITLTGNNTYTGTTTISSGILRIGNGGTTGTLGTGAVVDNGTLTFNRSDAITVANAISGTGALTQAGTGTTTLTANNTYSGTTTISTGTLQVGNGGTTGTLGTGAITDNAALVFNRSDAVSVASVISGSGSLTQSGTGTTTLTGNNTYTGGTTVATGMLQIGDGTNNGQIGSGTANIASGATLNFNVRPSSSANYSTTNTFTGTGTLQKTGAGSLTWSSASATFAMTGGLIDVQAGTLIGSNFGNEVWTNNKASLNVATGATFQGVEGNIFVDALTGGGTVSSGFPGYAYNLTVGVNNGSGTFSGVIQDANGAPARLSKTGTGTQTLTGTNTYTGVTTISGGVLQVGDGGTTGTLGTGAVTDNAALVFNRSNALTVANVISGTGTLTQSGTGTTILTGNNSYAGTTTINTGTLQVGSGSTTGTLGTGAVVDNASLVFNRSNTLLVTNAISGTGTLSQTGTGTTQLSADNSYAGTTTVSGGTLQVGNAGSTGTLGAGAVTLSNNANLSYVRSAATTVANNISGTGNVSATLTGAASDLTVGNTISLTGGTVNLVTDGNLAVTQAISTTNATSAAVFLVAGKSTAAGTATGGDVSLSGSGAVNVGTGGRITYATGSLTGSTGLGVVAGNNRYNSDETTTNYATALGAGAHAIYREQPLVTVQVNSASKTYDGNTFSGGTLNNSLAAGSLVNGDTLAAVTANTTYGGSSQTAKNASATPYVISASDTGGTGSNLNALGYSVSYTSGDLTISPKEVSLAAAKTYDGLTTVNGTQLSITTGVGSETLNYTGATIASKNVADNSSNYVNALTLTDGTGLASNYKAPDLTIAAAGKNTATLTAKSVTLDSISAASKTYDGTTTAAITAGVISGTAAGETLSVTGTGVFADKNVATGITVNVTDVTVLIKANGTGDWSNYTLSTTGAATTTANITQATLQAALTGTVEKTYDGTTAATNLSNSHFALTGFASSEGASVSQVNGSYASKNASDNSGTGSVSATLAAGDFAAASGTLLSNYQLPTSATGLVGKITPAPLTVKVNDTMAFVTQDASLATDNGLSYTGFVNGETAATALTGSPTRTYTGATYPVAGTYTDVYGLSAAPTANNGNYTVTVAKGKLTVAPADKLLIGIGGKTYTYGSLTGTTAGASADAVTAQYCLSGDCNVGSLVNLSMTALGNGNWQATDSTGTSVAFSTLIDSTGKLSTGGFVNVGNYTYDASSVIITPPSNVNFNDRVVNAGVLTIAPKVLTLSAADVSRVYDGSTALTGRALNTTGVMTADVVNASSTGGSFDSKNAGSRNYTFTGLSLGGADAGNYAFTVSTVTGTGSITPKAVTLVAGPVSKTYNGNTDFTVTQADLDTLSGQLITGDTVSSASISYTDKNVARDASGAVLSNKTITLDSVTLSDGNSGGNYTVTRQGNSASSITPKAVTLTSITAASKTYDGNDTASITAGAISTGVGSETLAIAGTGSFSDKNAGNNKTVTVADVNTLTKSNDLATGGDWANYNLTTVGMTTQADIAKKDVTLSSITAASKTYDGNDTANINAGAISTGVGAETLAIAGTGSFSDKNAGSNKTVTVTNVTSLTKSNVTATGGDWANYNLTTTGGMTTQADIAKKDVTLSSITAASKTYDGNDTASITAGAISTGVGAETLAIAGTGSFSDKNAGSNKTVTVTDVTSLTKSNVTATGGDWANYNLTTTGAMTTQADIAKKDVTLSSITAASKTYDGNDIASITAGAISTGVGSETLAIAGTGSFSDKNAGNNKTVTVADVSTLTKSNDLATGGDWANYNLTTVAMTTQADIAKKDVTLSSITAASKTYDGNDTASITAGAVTTGVGFETLVISGSGSFSDKNAGNNKTVTVTDVNTLTKSNDLATGGDWANYNLTTTGAMTTQADIAKKDVTLSSITAASKTYDGNDTASITAGAISTGVGAETLAIAGTGSFSDKNAGNNKTVTVTDVTSLTKSNVTGTGGDWANYNLTTTGAMTTQADISKKNLTISATASDKTYDANTTSTASLSSDKLSGDSLTLAQTSASFDTKNVGNGKTVTVSGLSISGTDAGNYNLTSTSTSTTANITKKSISLSGITAANKTYDGSTTATVSGTSAVFNGLIASDDLTVTSTGTFSDKTAATGKTVTLTNTLGGADLGNYTVTDQASTTADIDKKAISLSGITAANKTYDGTNAATVSVGTAVFNHQINGDDLTVSSSGTFSDKAAATGKTVTLSNTLGGGDLGNYTITDQTSTTANIDKKAISLSGITAANKTYDGTNAATVSVVTAVFNNQIAGDDLTVTSSGTFSDKAAATGKTVTLTNTLGGADLGNYTVTDQASTTADIDKKFISLSGITAANKTYDGTNAATVAFGSAVFNNQVAGDDLTVTSTGTFSDKAAATGKTVTLTNTLGGADLGNYTVTDQASTTADIDKKAISLSGITAANKTYDGTNAATVSVGTAVFNNQIYGDDLTVSSSGTFSDKAAATGKTVTLSNTLGGGDLGNYTITDQTSTTANIDKKAISLSGITAANKTYDGTNAATVSVATAVFNNQIAGDAITVSSSGTFSDKNAATGKTVALTNTLGGADLGNYTVTDQASTTADIDKKAISLSSITAASKTYDGNTSAVITQVGLTGFVGAETLGVTATGSFDDKNAGLRTVNVSTTNTTLSDDPASGGLTGNYQLVAGSVGSATTIAQKDAVVTANSDLSKVYNGTVQTVSGFSATGLVNGETAAVLTGVSAGATGKHAGTYSATASGTDNNYALSFVAGRLVIAPKAATVAVAPLTAVSNGTVFTQAPATQSGFVPGEDVKVTGLASGIAAGTYNSQLNVAPANSATVLDNYLIQIVNAALLITPSTVATPAVRPVFLSGPPKMASRLSWVGFSGTGTNASSTQRLTAATTASSGSAASAAAVAVAVDKTASPQACTPEGLQECECENTSTESVEICLLPFSTR